MIKVIIERQVKENEKLSPLLRELRIAALNQPGYISGETLVNTEDESMVAVVSTWRSLEDWKAWETSEKRADLYKLISQYLHDEPEVRTFRIMATE